MKLVRAVEPPRLAWVVCFGMTRSVDGGCLRCPLEGDAVAVTECLECRHLCAAADERTADRDCRMPDAIG